MKTEVLVAFGANLGDGEKTFHDAAAAIQETFGPVRTSSLIRTRAVTTGGGSGKEPDYWNAVLRFHAPSGWTPLELLRWLLALEKTLGRKRAGGHWAARTADLDLLLWDGLFLDAAPELVLPHPMIPWRDFVLGPACEIAPEWVHPLTGLTLREMRDAFENMDMTGEDVVFFSLYDHPTDLCTTVFWDRINFVGGKNPEVYQPAPLRAPGEMENNIAVLRTFPGMNIVLPPDGRATEKLVKFLVDFPEPVYVRVGRAAVPDVYLDGNFTFEIGKANTLHEGKDMTIIGAGETVWHALQAAKQLDEKGVSARVLDLSWIKPFDKEAVLKAARETGRIITVEEHSRFGGLGALVAETVSENPVPVRILGIPDENVVHGSSPEIFHHYGLDAEGIVKAALDFVK